MGRLFGKTTGRYAVSYFEGDRLQVAFLEGSEPLAKVIGKESVLKSEDITGDAIARFRERLKGYLTRSPIWIHLVQRHAAFVKVLTLPAGPRHQLEDALSRRIQQEIPYHAHDIVLHRALQLDCQEDPHPAVVCGISIRVLAEQINRLEQYGIAPAEVMLSTEVLMKLYRRYLLATGRIARDRQTAANDGDKIALLVYFFGGHVELLFFQGAALLHSRSFPEPASDQDRVRDMIRDSMTAFHREWRRKPAQILIFGSPSAEVASYVEDNEIQVKNVSIDNGSEKALAFLPAAAVGAYQSRDVFDFNLPDAKQELGDLRHSKGVTKLFFSMVVLSFSFFLWTFVQAAAVGGQMAWLHVQRSAISDSVKDLKQMRANVMKIQDLHQKKSLPLLIPVTLRKAMPPDLLLQELEYDMDGESVLLKGVSASQSAIDQWIAALQQQSIFARVTLGQVQGDRQDKGEMAYEFVIKALLNMEHAQ